MPDQKASGSAYRPYGPIAGILHRMVQMPCRRRLSLAYRECTSIYLVIRFFQVLDIHPRTIKRLRILPLFAL
jgi:hypothetical protein